MKKELWFINGEHGRLLYRSESENASDYADLVREISTLATETKQSVARAGEADIVTIFAQTGEEMEKIAELTTDDFYAGKFLARLRSELRKNFDDHIDKCLEDENVAGAWLHVLA